MADSEKDVLLKISRATSRVTNLDQLLKTSVRIVAQSLSVDRCSIWLADHKKRYATIKAIYTKKSLQSIRLGTTVDINKFPRFKRVISEGKFVHSPELSKVKANRFEKRFLAEAKIKSFLILPIKIKNRILGALNFGTLRKYKTFTPDEIRFCQIIATQIAVGIENASLYKELGDRAVKVQEQSIKVLRESEEKYRTLLENLPQMIFLKDENSVYVSANRNFCSALGIKPDEFRGRTDFDFFPKELAQKYRRDDREIIRTGKTKTIVEDYIEKGKRKIVHTVKTPVLGDDGKPIGVLGIFWDITEQKRADELLKESEINLRTILDNTVQAFILLDKNGKIRALNKTSRIWAKSFVKKELKLGDLLSDYISTEDLGKFQKHFRKALRGETAHDQRIVLGLWIEYVYSPVREGDKITGVCMSLLNIDEQKRAAILVKKSEERFRSLIENASDVVAILDKDLTILYQSPSLERVMGWKPEQTIGKEVAEFVHPEDFYQASKSFKRLIKNPKSIQSTEYRAKHKNGSWRVLEAVGKNLLQNPEVGGVVINYRDVTERKEAEQIQLALYEIAESVHRVKDLQELFKTIHKALNTILDTTNLYVALYDKNTDTISLSYCVDQKDKFTSFPAGKTLTAYVIKHDKPLLVTREVRKKLIKSGKVKSIGARSKIWLGVPLKIEDEVIGVIAVQSYTNPLAYGKKELEILKYASTQIASAIQQKKAEETLIRKERIARERARLLTDLRGLNKIDDILTRVCRSVSASGLFRRAVMTINKPGGEILNLGHEGLPAAEIQRARKASPLSPKLRARITSKRFLISDSYFIPVEAGVDFSKTGRYIPQKKKKSVGGNWQVGDELFVPLRDFSGKIMGYLSVDTPLDGSRPDRKTIEALEMLVEAAASRIREMDAQKVIKKERDFSNSVIETANSLIICLDHDARITAFNKECERITGYRRQEVLGKKWPEMFLPPEYRHKKLKSFASWVRAHPRDQYEGPVKTKRGEIRTILWSNTAILGSREKDLIAIAIGQDITERKRAESALRESEDRFRTIVETAPSLLIITDEKGNNLYVSPNCRDITGYTQKELLGKMIWWVHEDDTKRAKQIFDRSFREKAGNTNFEYRAVKKNGEVWYASSSWKPLRDEKGKFKGIILQTSDVTERKLAEEALRESEEKWRSLVKNAPNVIMIVNRDGTIQFINRTVPSMNVEETIGKSIYDYIEPEYHKVVRETNKHVFRTGESGSYQIKGAGPDNNIAWYETYVGPIMQNGQVIAATQIVTDITERKKAEEAVRESEERYRTVSELTSDYVAKLNIDSKNNLIMDMITDGFCRVSGYTVEEVRTPSKWRKAFHPDDRKKLSEFLKNIMSEYQGMMEIRGLTKKRKIRWLEVFGQPVWDGEKKRVVSIVLAAKDITERKLAEEALQLSQERYELSTKAAKVGVWDWDLKSNKFYIDPIIKQVLGYKDKEIPNDLDIWTTYVHPDDLKPVMASAQACIDGKTPEYVVEHRMMHKDGSVRWILSNGKVIRDRKGNPVRMIGTDTDVTKRKLAEEAFIESEQRFRMMAEASPDYIFQTDKHGNIIYCSPAVERILGYTPDERLGRKFTNIISPSELSRAKTLFKNVFAGEIVQNLEINLLHKSGRTVPVEVSVVPIFENGEVSSIFGIARDITQRKKAEEALQQSEETARAILNASFEVVLLVNPDGTIVALNDALSKVFGRKRDELVGKCAFDFMAPDLARHRKMQMNKAIRSGKPVRFEDKRGGLWLDNNIYPILDARGKVVKLAIFAHDITAHKKAEKATRESEKRYRSLFEDSPISLWEEDFSEVKRYVDKLKKAGIKDFRTYFENHPKAIKKCVASVKALDINRSTLRLFKAKSKEELKHNLLKTFVEESYKAFKEELIAISQGKMVFETEAVTQTLKGEKNNILIRWTVAPGYEQTFSKVLVSIIDITKRKKAEEKIRENEEQLRLLTDSLPVLISYVDSDQRYRFNNKRYEDWFGYSREEARGKHIKEVLGKSAYQKIRGYVKKALSGQKVTFENTVPYKDGRTRYVYASYIPDFGEKRKVKGFYALISDITEHKKADDALKESEEKIKNIFASIGDAITVTDLKGRVIECNQATLDLHGFSSKEEIFGENSLDFIVPKDHSRAKRNLRKTLEQGFIKDEEYTLLSADKREFPGELSASVVRSASGEPVAFVAITKDISERKEAEKILRKSRDLNTILQINYKISQIHDLDKMLQLTCQEAANALGVNRCSISLVDQEEKEGEVRAAYVKNQPHPQILGRKFLLSDFPQILRIYRGKEKFLHAPAVDKARISQKEKDYFKEEGVKSFVTVPIDAQKRLLGIFVVSSMDKKRVFAESEIAFIQTLASHLAVALQNIKLMEVVRMQAGNLRTLAQRVVSAQEGERKRIAQELHDEISQDLAYMKINTEITRKNVPAEFDQVIQRIKDNENLIIQTLNKVRDLTSYLRPPLLDDLGLVETLRWYIKEFSRITNIKVTLISDKYRRRLTQDLEMVLYRISQEALANVAKHARATQVSILLEKKNNFAVLTVKDDGIGFDVKKVMREQKEKRGFGLFSMEERVKLLNGSFNLTSKLKKGTSLEVRLPCPKGR